MRCPNCRTENPAAAKFCMNCASPLSRTAGPQPAPGERRIVTMLFSDVKGSTAAAEQLDPEDWAEIMNAVFDFMIRPVVRYEGTVARLMGDAILAFFGAPVAHEDDPRRAVLAGMAVVNGFGDAREQIRSDWGIDIDLRVGINTGLVMVGDVGSDLQREFTALGDAINLAARMEQTAAPGTVQVSEHTHRLTAPLFDWEDLGFVEVKGKDEPVRTYRPLREKAHPGRLRGLEAYGLRSALIGREVEIGRLKGKLADLAAGRGGFIFLTGEAGLGKSRLLDEVRSTLPDISPALAWYEGQSLSYQQSGSYVPWRQVIRSSIRAGGRDDPAEVRRKLRASANTLGLSGEETAFLETLLAVESESTLNAVDGMDGESLSRRLGAAVQALVAALARAAPLALVFDDLHWVDAASLDLIRGLTRLVPEVPLLVLAVTRPDREAGVWGLRSEVLETLPEHALEILLLPLSGAAGGRLVSGLLASGELPARIVDLLLEKSEGNPFYVEELLRTLIERGQITREGDRWMAPGDLSILEIPDTLDGILTARIDRLSTEEKAILQVASVIGRRFDAGILAEVLEAA